MPSGQGDSDADEKAVSSSSTPSDGALSASSTSATSTSSSAASSSSPSSSSSRTTTRSRSRPSNPTGNANPTGKAANTSTCRVHLVCPYCQKVFEGDATYSGVRSNFRRHLRVHTLERPYKCPFCADAFTTSTNKKRHVRIRHAELASPAVRASRHVTRTPPRTIAAPRTPSPSHGSAVPPRAPPPFALPRTTAATAVAGPERNAKKLSPCTGPSPTSPSLSAAANGQTVPPPTAALEQCAHCGKCFGWHATRVLHEVHCRGPTNPVTDEATRKTSRRAQKLSLESAVPAASPAPGPAPTPPPPPPPVRVFTCDYCELEVSSRTRLRRHMRYYCPFRDDVFADPFDDALDRQTAALDSALSTPLRHAHRHGEEEEDDGDASADERRAARTLSRRAGLKYYEDADNSNAEDELDTSLDSQDEGRAQDSRQSLHRNQPPPANDTLLWLFGSEDTQDAEDSTAAATDADGAIPSVPELVVVSSDTASSLSSSCSLDDDPPRRRARRYRRGETDRAGSEASPFTPPRRLRDETGHTGEDEDEDTYDEEEEEEEEEEDEDEDEAAMWPQLDFKRRAARGSRKRTRRIMLKRLRHREAPHPETTPRGTFNKLSTPSPSENGSGDDDA